MFFLEKTYFPKSIDNIPAFGLRLQIFGGNIVITTFFVVKIAKKYAKCWRFSVKINLLGN